MINKPFVLCPYTGTLFIPFTGWFVRCGGVNEIGIPFIRSRLELSLSCPYSGICTVVWCSTNSGY